MSTRQRLRELVDAPRFQQAIIGVILINAVTLGCETSPALVAEHGTLLHAADRIALAVFTLELAARLYAHGPRFFRDPWNCFDAVIVGLALLPTSGPFAVLRALRILRALRLISAIPSMRRVVGALLGALPGMASIAALLGLILYVGSVIATKLFSAVAPEYFGDLGDSLFTLFQVMTGEAWSEVARSVMEAEPLAWIFFIGYIAVTTFTVLNLFIAVTVSAMQSQVAREHEIAEENQTTLLLAEIQQLREEVRAMHSVREQTSEN
ncbi:ion transporter [Saccharopolyspora dendranthemae]|uniref:Voltage-gated sodium channel n=1 Tax=Saccharopolyspora dendranthemae TaxID=1181886 RepID=A0A561U7A2_9PSEU|nr:ion transporter [Saccharopolyspora dendranthemae]TWF95241.1 voltage-gated sodium channel [Saccharopolyspora dendranthemae]